ncbi:trifunctional purine biosynthetic protein adenosine-3-like [Mantella aurantiaca]
MACKAFEATVGADLFYEPMQEQQLKDNSSISFTPKTQVGSFRDKEIQAESVLTSNRALLQQFCKDHNISLVVISPIPLLSAGLVDDLSASGVTCFGPTAKAALLQADKSNAKGFMQQYGIPTARWKSFTNPHEACHFITYTDFPALVVKTCVYASGERLCITRDKDEACRAVQHLTKDWTPGASTAPLIVEEFLQGEEFYCLGITDGTTLIPMPPVIIKKPSGDLHKFQLPLSSENVMMSEDVYKNIHRNILKKAISGLRQEGRNYKGLFGAKIMVTTRGPVVLGLICTFQELDNQVISPLCNSDLYELIQTAIEGRLSSYLPMWSQGTSLSYPSSKQRDIQARHRDPEELVAMMKVGMCESNVKAVASSSTKAMGSLEAFPAAIYSKDGGCLDNGQPYTERPNPQIPNETHGVADSASRTAENEALMNIHQTSGKIVCSFEVNTAQYKDPVFLCTTNSIGNKIKVAQACSLQRLAAQDLVMVCMNALLSRGAQTLFFIPYFACDTLQPEVAESVLEGLAEACKTTGSSLLDRAMVQQSGMRHDGGYSLSGCALGVVEREYQLPRPDQMREGDVVIGISSPGLHCSRLDLLRNILEKHSMQFTSAAPLSHGAATWGELVMSSAMVYSPSLLRSLRSAHIRACVSLHEGGIVGSILQYLPSSIAIVIDALCWKIPPLYSWLCKEGGLSEKELADIFSCGLGGVIIAQRSMAQQILAEIQQEEEAWMVGGVIQHKSDSPQVRVSHLLEALKINAFQLLRTAVLRRKPAKISKVAVFISNTGIKLKTLIDTLRQLASSAKLALVISNKGALEELRKAVAAGIPTRVIDHTLFSCHCDFETTISKVLDEFSIDVICLAGFGRMLSEPFLAKWKGKILKLRTQHSPSQKVEGASGKAEGVYGCSVSFLLGGSSSPGPTVLQETVLADSEVPVTELIEEAEPRAVAKALHLLSSGTLQLGADNYISWRAEE